MSDWYYAADNEQKGPINESELKANLAANKIPADSLVWKDGMDNWTPANQVAAFSFRQPPTPAAVQPTVAGATAAAPADKADPSVNNPDSTKPISLNDLVGEGKALEVDPEDADKNKIFGILAYIGILCLVPILAAKDSPYAKYHANQGLVLFILEVILAIVINVFTYILAFLPGFLGFIGLVFSLLWLGPLVLLILGVINAAAGKCVPLPIIGKFKLLK